MIVSRRYDRALEPAVYCVDEIFATGHRKDFRPLALTLTAYHAPADACYQALTSRR